MEPEPVTSVTARTYRLIWVPLAISRRCQPTAVTEVKEARSLQEELSVECWIFRATELKPEYAETCSAATPPWVVLATGPAERLVPRSTAVPLPSAVMAVGATRT